MNKIYFTEWVANNDGTYNLEAMVEAVSIKDHTMPEEVKKMALVIDLQTVGKWFAFDSNGNQVILSGLCDE